MKKDKYKELLECAVDCETFDEFAETCGHLINDTDLTAQEAWDLYCSQYNEN